MKAKLTTIFITTLVFSGLIIFGLVSQLKLGEVEAPFDQLVYFMYVIPLAVSAVATNITYKIIQ
jgi:ABC-type sugar transport system permease subunit